MGLRLDGDGELQVSREPSRPRYGPAPSLSLRFSGKTGNLRSGDELPSHDVNFVGPGTRSTKPCGGEPWIQFGPSIARSIATWMPRTAGVVCCGATFKEDGKRA